MKNPALLLFVLLHQGADAVAFLNPNRPPIGAIYEKAIGIPVLGQQTFSLHILSDRTAHLLVKGMLFLDELVPYTVTPSGCLNCRLSEKALRTMRKVRASLQEVGYNVETDTPYVKVSTPLPVPVKINLERKDSVSDEGLLPDQHAVLPDAIFNSNDDATITNDVDLLYEEFEKFLELN